MQKLFHIILIILLITYSCGYFEKKFCGELNLDQKKFLVTLNEQYKNSFDIYNIPCDLSYLHVTQKSDSIDEIMLLELHKQILRNSDTTGWFQLTIYDKEKRFLYHHMFAHWDSTFNKVYENLH